MARVAQTGGMIALVPRAVDAARMAVAAETAEPVGELHLTLAYLGDDVTGWSPDQRETLLANVRSVAGRLGPIEARVMGHAMFNPDGHDDRDPCAVYLVADSTELGPLREEMGAHADADQHEPFLPHVTAGYGVDLAALRYTGPIVFDQLRVALAGDDVYVPLGRDGNPEPSGDPDPDDAETKREDPSVSGDAIQVKAKVASEAGERRYGKPIGTELGQARNAAAQQAQDNPRARDQYETLVNASPRDYRSMLDDLSAADLKALTAAAYSFRSSNPTVVQARIALAGAMKRKGLNVDDYGGLGKGAPGGKGKAPARKRTGKTATPKRTKLTTGRRREINAAVRGDSVNAEGLSEGQRESLLQAGWKGRPGDGAEKLYRPGSKSLEGHVDPEFKRTTTKPWETRKAQRGGKTIGADKSTEKGGGDEYPVRTIGDIAAGVKRAKAIKDPERRAEVLAHLRKGAKAIGGPAVNMVPKDDAAGGDDKGKGKGGFVPFKKGGKKDAFGWGEVFTSGDAALLAAIESKVMSPDPRAAKLREYWAHGAGRAKWNPGTPGDFKRLRNHLRKYVPTHMLNGLTANIHKLATGQWPGKGRDHGKTGEPEGLESKGMVTLDKGELARMDALGSDDADAVDLALDRYADMGDEVTSEDAYEQALADEVDWELEIDGTVSRADGEDDDEEIEPDPEPDPESERAAEDGVDALAALFEFDD